MYLSFVKAPRSTATVVSGGASPLLFSLYMTTIKMIGRAPQSEQLSILPSDRQPDLSDAFELYQQLTELEAVQVGCRAGRGSLCLDPADPGPAVRANGSLYSLQLQRLSEHQLHQYILLADR